MRRAMLRVFIDCRCRQKTSSSPRQWHELCESAPMLIALTNDLSSKLADQFPSIDIELARRQQQHYRDALARHGAQVECLRENEQFPDGCFVEDVAVVVDELAVMTTMGTGDRRGEPDAFVKVLERYRPVERIARDASLEGGDVLTVGRRVFVGVSRRTDERGVAEMHRLLTPHGYDVRSIDVRDGLHLKTACTAIDADTIIANPEWVNAAAFEMPHVIDVHPDEPYAANVLRVRDTILMHERCGKTLARLRARFSTVEPLDISEFVKASAGLTCLSIIFEH
jgi:dimethylargininase